FSWRRPRSGRRPAGVGGERHRRRDHRRWTMTPPGALGRRRGPVAAALVTGVVTLVAFALLTASVARGTRRAAEETFIASADQSVAALEQQIRTYLDELRDIGAFMANARTPTAEEFAGFVE